MKTQISNLINGRKNVLRDLNHVKYSDAKIATSHIGYAGTNKEVRNRIAALVREENKDGMNADEIFRYKRNNERQQWKMTNWSYVGEELVTIK